MARENPRWGCVRICGELRKLGMRVGATTIRMLLRRHGLGPAPRRCGPTWAQFLQAQAEGIVACDFFTVATIWLQTLDVLFFMQVSTRQVVAVGVTAQPDSSWVAQQARNATMELNDRQLSTRFLLRDHDAKFTSGFDEVFRTEGAQVIRTPIRAPKANAYAERWVQSVRVECLDWTLVLGRRHLLRLLHIRAPQVLSWVLKPSANRAANIVAGTVMTLVQVGSLFVGDAPSPSYLFFSVVEIGTTAFIVWYAWTRLSAAAARS